MGPNIRQVMVAAQAAPLTWTWVPILAAGVAGVFALIGIFASLLASRKDRRRELYAEAYRTALAMVEMVYRVRRAGSDNSRDLADRFHQIHEDINFHQGWIETESEHMGRAYRRLILRIHAETKLAIKQGWMALRTSTPEAVQALSGDHPDVTAAKTQFLADVSSHLSLLKRDDLRERYSDREWRRIRGELPNGDGGTFYDPVSI